MRLNFHFPTEESDPDLTTPIFFLGKLRSNSKKVSWIDVMSNKEQKASGEQIVGMRNNTHYLKNAVATVLEKRGRENSLSEPKHQHHIHIMIILIAVRENEASANKCRDY
ncbi:unnamed protein product [Orchesella dallaii]|uniref:Uncharacterized protein n=1 Tax=Orchesella dallaii TaxID=48710 RepID=A0ABP1QHL5_9HEXA